MRDPAEVDEIVGLLRMFYAAEIYGAASTTLMLKIYDGLEPDHRRKLEACRLLTLEAAERLRRQLVETLGVEVRPPTRTAEMAQLVANQPRAAWSERMATLQGACERGLDAYLRLQAIYGGSAPELCAALVAKQIAIRDLARLEAKGEPADTIAPVVRLLGPDGIAGLKRFDAQDQTARGG